MPLAQLASQAWAARAAKKYCGAVRRLAALPCASRPIVKDHRGKRVGLTSGGLHVENIGTVHTSRSASVGLWT